MGKNNSLGTLGDVSDKLPQSKNQKQTDNNDVKQNKNAFNNDKKVFNFKPLTEDNLANMINNAETIAEKIARKKDSYTQIRKFYDELVSLQKKVKNDNDFEKIQPMIYLVKSKAAYALGRDNIAEIFYEFITQYVSNIVDKNSLNSFLLYFEAVLGYIKYYNKLMENKNAK